MAKVTIYSTPTCPYCMSAKEFFNENNIEFTNIDVSSDSEASEEMIEKSGQMGVPVIIIEEDGNEEIIIGFAKLGEVKIASVLAFKHQENILLYNSGFDPQYGRLSPGLILKAYLIKRAIERKFKIFDFLRGGERYKFELGAIGVKLYQFSVNL